MSSARKSFKFTTPTPGYARPRKPDLYEEIPWPDSTRGPSLTPKDAEAALKALFDTDNFSASSDDTSDASVPGLRKEVGLKLHQVEGRAWMRDREDSAKKSAGGLLADDMGVGKTLQMILQILDRPLSDKDAEDGWRNATLVVCPVGVIQHWEKQIKEYTTGLTVVSYHGSSRNKIAFRLPDADVVLTSYGVVCSEHSTDDPGTALFTTNWLRVVLDEAHVIKNRKTQTAEGCFSLRAKFRWCLTATPMPNAVEDFYSLFKFLRIKPVNDWECFNTQIILPILKGTGAGLAMKRLQVVLKHVMLRRVKAQLDCLKLPNRSVKLISCKFNASEKAFYTALQTCADSLIARIQAKKSMTGGTKYISVLVLLLRLRQICDHPSLVLDGYEEAMKEDGISAQDGDEFDLDNNGLHIFPLANLGEHSDKAKCVICLVRLTQQDDVAVNRWPNHCAKCAALKVQAENFRGPMGSSAKIREIIPLLRRIDEVSDGQEKTVIFSQFTSMLDIIEPFLLAAGVGFVRYDGKMSPQARKAALIEIERDPCKTVLLASLKVGGVGLDLTVCNHIILVDMWWNPSVEDQAFDRTHRIGQTRDVHIYKLKIDNTVEDRMLELQEKKRELTKASLSGDQNKNMKLGMDELLNLFK
ncbi:SNF2 family N-terminal domain-containing protein, partial [Mycena pura]